MPRTIRTGATMKMTQVASTIAGSMYGAQSSSAVPCSRRMAVKPTVMPTPRRAAIRQAVVSASSRSEPADCDLSHTHTTSEAIVVSTP